MQVLYAKVPLASMTVVDGDMVATKTMPAQRGAANSISDPVQVVGRMLTVPLLEGQPFTTNCFASESNASVAAAVGKGKRAVGISVTDYAGLEGLLYPGSVVDVMVTLKDDIAGMSRPSEQGRAALATTLLERVQVLAIERQTVVSGTADKVGSDVESSMRPNNTRRVTLLVDTKQAKILQLAMEQGTLSLALRNPLDTTPATRTRFRCGASSACPTEDRATERPTASPRRWRSACREAVNAAERRRRRRRSGAVPRPVRPADAARHAEVGDDRDPRRQEPDLFVRRRRRRAGRPPRQSATVQRRPKRRPTRRTRSRTRPPPDAGTAGRRETAADARREQ